MKQTTKDFIGETCTFLVLSVLGIGFLNLVIDIIKQIKLWN